MGRNVEHRNLFEKVMDWLDWDFFAIITLITSIAIYILAPIMDYQNLRTSGYAGGVSIYSSFSATNNAGLIFASLTFTFTLVDYLIDKKIYGSWFEGKRKIAIVILQLIASSIFFVLFILVNMQIINWD